MVRFNGAMWYTDAEAAQIVENVTGKRWGVSDIRESIARGEAPGVIQVDGTWIIPSTWLDSWQRQAGQMMQFVNSWNHHATATESARWHAADLASIEKVKAAAAKDDHVAAQVATLQQQVDALVRNVTPTTTDPINAKSKD